MTDTHLTWTERGQKTEDLHGALRIFLDKPPSAMLSSAVEANDGLSFSVDRPKTEDLHGALRISQLLRRLGQAAKHGRQGQQRTWSRCGPPRVRAKIEDPRRPWCPSLTAASWTSRQAFMAAAPSGPTTDLVSLKSLYITALVIFAVGVLEQRKIFN